MSDFHVSKLPGDNGDILFCLWDLSVLQGSQGHQVSPCGDQVTKVCSLTNESVMQQIVFESLGRSDFEKASVVKEEKQKVGEDRSRA